MLLENRYFYGKIVDEIPLPIYVFQDGDFKFYNQAFVDLSGYNRDEISNVDFLDLVHPNYRDTLMCLTRLALSDHSSDLPSEFELQVLRKDGETRWVRIQPRVIEHDNQTAVLGVVSDISKYKNPEGLKRKV